MPEFHKCNVCSYNTADAGDMVEHMRKHLSDYTPAISSTMPFFPKLAMLYDTNPSIKKIDAAIAAKKELYKSMYGGGDPEPVKPDGYEIKTVEPVYGGIEGDKIVGHKTLYHETWDADLYNYGSQGMNGIKVPFWRSKSGQCKRLVDIELTHLKNIINLIMKKDANFKNRLIFKQLLQEQKRREVEGELW